MKTFNKNSIGIHLDVGHDSIGWCATGKNNSSNPFVDVLGAGVVLFQADDCLAIKRREFRRQRRHIRSTRQRIARMKAILLSKGVLTEGELNKNPISSPWKLAAQVLTGGRQLTWLELWCVLRWYAHNRGYDGNVLSSLRSGRQIDKDDIEKNAAARELMKKHATSSMAETMCKELGVDPDGKTSSSMMYFKGLKVSFDRQVVVDEVARILQAHMGKLPGLDADLVHTLMADPAKEPCCLRGRNDLPFRVPVRYWGGVLFGQLAPRFENRIIGACPVSGGKLPSKATPEFLNYRWAMMLANVLVGERSRRLEPAEMAALNEKVKAKGGFTKREFKKLVASVTGEKTNNLDALLTAPDADKSLVCYPGLYALTKHGLDAVLTSSVLHKLAHQLFRGKTTTLRKIGQMVADEKQDDFKSLVKSISTKGRRKSKSEDLLLADRISAEFPAGRAPYSREVLVKATAAIFAGNDPRMKGGILYRDATKADILPADRIDAETNNHLIRHRVKILLRLLKDIVHDYAENNPARVAQVTIEMARDLKDLSGKTNKEIVSELNLKTAQHRAVAKKLAELLNCDVSAVSAGLIRKARVAEDMGYTCPYTGWKYDLQDVVSKNVDLDHILPRSQRASDSLDSMVLTFTEVNRMKGARTGLEFVREFGGQRVSGRDNLVVLSESKYRSLVEGLKLPGYSDDRKRQKRRIEKLLRLHAEDAGMTEGMLTRTSYITTLAAKAIRGFFANCGRMPRIVSVPGRVTACLRMQWNLMGELATIDPRVLDQQGNLRVKSEMRGITHMHHAVDAITLGLAATLLPIDGSFWATMCKRRVSRSEADALRALGIFSISANGEPRLIDLPQSMRQSIHDALAEQRVVVHMPQRRDGLKVQLNTWGVEKVDDEGVHIRQRNRDEKTGKIETKRDVVPKSKVFGLSPENGCGKLKAIKGVLLPDKNFGVALTNPPQIVRYWKVWNSLTDMISANANKLPAIVHRGSLIKVKNGCYKGIWSVIKMSAKQRDGIVVDIAPPYANKSYAREARMTTLIKSGIEILKPRYTGIPLCPTTSSISQAKARSSP